MSNATTASTARKVIYDTDPGVDDAMALYYALAHPGIDVVGITTTFGNVTVEQAATNGLYLTEIAGRKIPVTLGVKTPWLKAPGTPPDFIHGGDGLGNLPSRVATTSVLDPRPSAQFIVDMARAHPGEITLVAVGPLGNLATALKLEPNLPKLLKEVFIMGGTVVEPGNVSPVAEANIWNDPHSADFVFTAGWKLTMVGLDVTHQLIVPLALFKKVADHHKHIATDTLHHAVSFYADFYSGIYPHVAKIHGCFGHDVLAFVALTNPELFEIQTGRIRVALDGPANGQTMMRRKDIFYPQPGWGDDVPDTHACLQLKADEALQLIETTLMSSWL
jgi:inosine-uridine nucleoside N-ribohydrolase